jgi:hypothetical protein
LRDQRGRASLQSAGGEIVPVRNISLYTDEKPARRRLAVIAIYAGRRIRPIAGNLYGLFSQ